VTALPKVLVVSPHFPPVNTADMQRVRMLLPFFRDQGWEAEVLAVSPGQVASPQDPWLMEGLPTCVPVHTVEALGLAWSWIPGFGTLGLRALRALDREGRRILAAGSFDLVYFSTTVFEVHGLGPRWTQRFGVPFVMDYQDPWVNDYYREHPEVVPPGGRLKHAFAEVLHRWMEPRVLRACAGLTAVSQAYPDQLARRYPALKLPPCLVQPFPGAARDFERLGGAVAPAADGLRHWVYVGRGGPDMAPALRGLFLALRDHAPVGLLENLRLHFIGTSYAAPGLGETTLAPLAAEFGLAHLVEEQPGRIPYAETLGRLRAADALLVPGSDDPAYTASKIYPYLLARRPLLAIFHQDSSVVDLMGRVGGGVCVPFASDEPTEALAERIAAQWLQANAFDQVHPLDEAAFLPFTDAECARQLGGFLRARVGS
jgi:hypothetical protein